MGVYNESLEQSRMTARIEMMWIASVEGNSMQVLGQGSRDALAARCVALNAIGRPESLVEVGPVE